MVKSTTEIQTGMDVYSSDGEKIGEVKEIYRNSGSGTGQAGDRDAAGDVVVEVVDVVEIVPDALGGAEAVYETAVVGTPSRAGAGSTTETGYLKVEHRGMLGLGAKDLYIPVSAVTDVVPGDRLTVSCQHDECMKQYEARPDFLDKQNVEENRG